MSCGEPHEIDCRDVLAEVYLYLDVECDSEQRGRIRKHLDECSPCLREFGIELEVKTLVARCCGRESAPAELHERLRSKLRQLVMEAEGQELLTE